MLTTTSDYIETTANDAKAETYTIVSKIAYLIGVEKRIFENPYEAPQMEQFVELEKNRDARIIRNLSMLRTKIEQHFGAIHYAMRYEMKNLYSLPEYIPTECLAALEQDGITIVKANYKLNRYIIDINQHISNRINNCKSLFPIWLNWSYVRDMFIMPFGNTEEGIKTAAEEYYKNMQQYPYQAYINWPVANQGNILYFDRKFVTLLYEIHEDCFTDFDRVCDAGDMTKQKIYAFMDASKSVAIIVDCENADPYKFFGVLDSLKQDTMLSGVKKIILYNDVHASSAWKSISRFTNIPVEHHMTERIKENKSLVDIQLTAGVCKEHYENGVDSVILVSSDSDYWGMITMLPQVNFLVLVEKNKCSQAIKDALKASGIVYCHMDEFCMANTTKVRKSKDEQEKGNNLC